MNQSVFAVMHCVQPCHGHERLQVFATTMSSTCMFLCRADMLSLQLWHHAFQIMHCASAQQMPAVAHAVYAMLLTCCVKHNVNVQHNSASAGLLKKLQCIPVVHWRRWHTGHTSVHILRFHAHNALTKQAQAPPGQPTSMCCLALCWSAYWQAFSMQL